MQKRKLIWKLINQVAKIIKQPENEIELSKQMLGNFQTEIHATISNSRLK